MRNLVCLLVLFLSAGNADAYRPWPVSGQATPDIITSCFGPRLPPQGGTFFHRAFDIRRLSPFQVHSVESGEVFRVLTDRVIIEHGWSDFWTTYLHLTNIVVDEGESVSQGQLIGDIDATANHLHFCFSIWGSDLDDGMHPNDPYLDLYSIDDWFPYVDWGDPGDFRIDRDPSTGDIIGIEFLIIDDYNQSHGRADFLSVEFHYYGGNWWFVDELDLNDWWGEEVPPFRTYLSWGGDATIAPEDFNPDVDHKLTFYWTVYPPVPYVDNPEVGYLAIALNDFDDCLGHDYGCAWGNTWHSSPELSIERPSSFEITELYPNPFNSSAKISYSLNGNSSRNLEMALYDILGRRVKTICKEAAAPGIYNLVFDNRTDNGAEAASGVYFILLKWGNQAVAQRVTLLK